MVHLSVEQVENHGFRSELCFLVVWIGIVICEQNVRKPCDHDQTRSI